MIYSDNKRALGLGLLLAFFHSFSLVASTSSYDVFHEIKSDLNGDGKVDYVECRDYDVLVIEEHDRGVDCLIIMGDDQRSIIDLNDPRAEMVTDLKLVDDEIHITFALGDNDYICRYSRAGFLMEACANYDHGGIVFEPVKVTTIVERPKINFRMEGTRKRTLCVRSKNDASPYKNKISSRRADGGMEAVDCLKASKNDPKNKR